MSSFQLVQINNERQIQLTDQFNRVNLSNPEIWSKTFDTKRYNSLKKISRLITIAARIFCLIVIIKCFYSLICSIPSEISQRIASLELIHEQIRENCLTQYTENKCNTTTLPDLIPFCQQQLECIEKPFVERPTWAVAEYFLDLKDVFFRTLNSRSSVLFGMVSAIFAFFGLKKVASMLE